MVQFWLKDGRVSGGWSEGYFWHEETSQIWYFSIQSNPSLLKGVENVTYFLRFNLTYVDRFEMCDFEKYYPDHFKKINNGILNIGVLPHG
jgi:hypothetical protein